MTEHLQAVISSKQPVVDYGSTTSSATSATPSTSTPITRTQRLPSFVLINESPNPNRYARMSHNKLHGDSQEPLERLEYFLNVLNQMCIGFITIYISYITLRTGLQGTGLHAWLVTIGVSLLSDEYISSYVIYKLSWSSSRSSWPRALWCTMAAMC